MHIELLSEAAQDGLRRWAVYQHADEMLFDDIASLRMQWAWAILELKVAADRPEWFPHGKWATIQLLEKALLAEAESERRK